ncbi:hypothetical protein Tco_1214126 [Tanacetum coccineum]
MLELSWIEAMQEEIHEFETASLGISTLSRFRDGDQAEVDLQKFSKGVVDPTLFTRKAGRDILLLKMSMMGKMSFFLGLQISQSPRGIFINQSNYALEIIKKYGMLSSDPVDTPMAEKSKLDEDLQGKPVDPTHYHRTIDMGWYSKDSYITLTAYADADHDECQDTRRSTSGSARFLREKLVSWSSKKQNSTAISSTEAEYIVENGVVELYFVRTEYQLADIFTKALPRERFNFLVEKMGMKSMSPETLKILTEERMSNGDNNSVIILKASISLKRKLDLITGINFLGHGLLHDHAKACVYFET